MYSDCSKPPNWVGTSVIFDGIVAYDLQIVSILFSWQSVDLFTA